VTPTASPSPTSPTEPVPAPRPYFRPFRPEDAAAFRELNEAWIQAFFIIEEEDRVSLDDPQGHILEPGGHIFVAVEQGEVVGCCALIPHGPGVFEVAKMAVAERLRGRGIGRQLLSCTIEQARALGAKSLYLESNSRLANAVHLYESLGFRHLPAEERTPSPYARANVFMDLKL
jgi:ribosomal protein S18 acetylase RimI-like enzyme